MNQTSASHRTLVLLALVVTASRGLSFSRGKLSEIGVLSYAIVLVGLAVVLFLGGRWRGSGDTKGGFSTWQVFLPCAFVYVFSTNAGRHLLISSPEIWHQLLSLHSEVALFLALPVLLLASQRFRDRLTHRWQIALLLLPLMLVLAFFLLVPFASPTPSIDVFLFQMEAARNLVSGQNPYETVYEIYTGLNLYPGGIPDSYPYPPLSFPIGLAGYVLGDVRWALIACHIGAALTLYATARQRRLPATEAISLAGLFFYLPHAPLVSEQAWMDPSVALSLGMMSLLLARRRPQAALWAAGVALALKQTMVILLPVLWGLWRRLDRALLTAVFAISALSYGVFLLWDAGALWKDVVLFHMETPFRKDALTLSAFLVHFLGVSPLPSWLSLVGLVGGSIAALFALRPAEGGVSPCDSDRLWRFFVGLAFALLLTLVLSKHAFMNYYYMVHFVMIQALVWSRVTDREATTA